MARRDGLGVEDHAGSAVADDAGEEVLAALLTADGLVAAKRGLENVANPLEDRFLVVGAGR